MPPRPRLAAVVLCLSLRTTFASAAETEPPTPEQLAQVKKLQERISAGGRATAILLAISIVGMSSAQYLLF